MPEGRPDTMVAAINRTLNDEMARNPRIVVFGEDVADCSHARGTLRGRPGKGGVFKVTHGLQREFGDDRVFNSPLAEANIVGRAIGMATRGLKPVVEIQFFDYIWPAMMQIRDELTMLRYRSNNVFSCPMVIRVPIGGYLRGGAPVSLAVGREHLRPLPGPAHRLSVQRARRGGTAAHGDPLRRSGAVPRAQAPVSPDLQQERLSRARLHDSVRARRGSREGRDVTVLTWGALVQRTLLAAQQAEREGIGVRVIDLRSLMPFDWDTISQAVRETSRVVVAHEDQLTCGFGAELAARIGEEWFAHLDAPVLRVAALDTPVAYAPALEEVILPQASDVLAAIRKSAKY